MLKICPVCRQTWSGGRDCPKCGAGHPLIDVAGPQGRRTFLRDRESHFFEAVLDAVKRLF